MPGQTHRFSRGYGALGQGVPYFGSQKRVRCLSMGKRQSPILIPEHVDNVLAPAVFDYTAFRPVVHEGPAGLVLAADAGSVSIDGVEYSLVQLHVHSPSEHTLDGRVYDAELHFVHQHASGDLAVVGVLVQLDLDADVLQGLADAVSAFPEPSPVEIDPAQLYGGAEFYDYLGSLTTEPHSENAHWLVSMEILGATQDQLDALRNGAAKARPTQPIHGRSIGTRSWVSAP